MSFRDSVNFVPHLHVDWRDPRAIGKPISNLVHKSDKEEEQWIVETTAAIGEWRSKSRTTYIRWALAINAMIKVADECKGWPDDKLFVVHALRRVQGQVTPVPLAEWLGAEASKHNDDASRLVAATGICDLYSCLEDIVFSAYRKFIDHHPQTLLGGADNKELRKLYYLWKRDPDAALEWPARWRERVEKWQRKRLYDGLGTVFKAYTEHAGLKKPSWYRLTTPTTWAATITGIAELRNLLTHGASAVSAELDAFSRTSHNAGFDFVAGNPIEVKLVHMMGVEAFIDQLLTALNASLLERALGPNPALQLILG